MAGAPSALVPVGHWRRLRRHAHRHLASPAPSNGGPAAGWRGGVHGEVVLPGQGTLLDILEDVRDELSREIRQASAQA